MERKKSLFKNFMFVFVALSLLATGIFVLNQKPRIANATVEATEVDNSKVPTDFFVKKEFEGENVKENDNLAQADIFAYYNQGTTKNSFQISFLTNGSSETRDGIYEFVLFPDSVNTPNLFKFYTNIQVSLSVNGEDMDVSKKTFAVSSGQNFTNFNSTVSGIDNPSSQPQSFEINFVGENIGQETVTETDNKISIMKDGKVVEGLYSVHVEMVVVTCNNAKTDKSEDSLSFSEEPLSFTYNFYVVERANYIANNRPNVNASTNNGFDSVVPVSDLTNTYSYYLYSNYSNEDNKIPYIEYDLNRFDVSVTKVDGTTQRIQYETESQDFETSGNVVKVRSNKETKKVKIFFTDVGDYLVRMNAIQVVELDSGTVKYALDGITNALHPLMTYIYGYQLKYTSYDSTPVDGVYPKEDLKWYDINFETATFKDSADITGAFLKSNATYSQNSSEDSTNGSNTFTMEKIIKYLNEGGPTIDGEVTPPPKPVQTNQNPFEFTGNANLDKEHSFMLTTNTNLGGTYLGELDIDGLGEQALYYSQFTGQVEGSEGVYVYLLAYTYENLKDSPNSSAAKRMMYQVFYFEITPALQDIDVAVGAQGGESISKFVNQNVFVTDTTKDERYKKDITVQIYAVDYERSASQTVFVEGFGGANGIRLQDKSDGNNTLELSANAHYTIRLYVTSELKSLTHPVSTNFNEKTGFLRELSFTIDKNPVENIIGRNIVQADASASRYTEVSVIENFATNQNFALAWDKKKSGAETHAFYKIFPIVSANIYSSVSETVDSFINQSLTSGGGVSTLPINYMLDLENTDSSWIPYSSNTKDQTIISSQQRLSGQGLYLIDVYDDAGNHSYKMFLLDYTTPLFALYRNGAFELTSQTMYVDSSVTLYWGSNKSIYIKGIDSELYQNTTPENVDAAELTSPLYATIMQGEKPVDKDGAKHIYELLYYTLFSEKDQLGASKTQYMQYIQYLNLNLTEADNVAVESYSSMYLTIPIVDTYYYLDNNHKTPTRASGYENNYSMRIDVPQYSDGEDESYENIYQVLIRDESNTVLDFNVQYNSLEDLKTNSVQYTNHYSARQLISVSFDASKLDITFKNSAGEDETLITSTITQRVDADDVENQTKLITYLSPSKLEEPLNIYFTPTPEIANMDINIQVQSIEIDYYEFEIKSEKHEDKTPNPDKNSDETERTSYYLGFSKNPAKSTPYVFDGNNANSNLLPISLNVDETGWTRPGKYVITRTYKLDENYGFNPRDYYQREYVLIVDRNDVISLPEGAPDNSSHYESMVGGDIFVAMFDNGNTANFVVTFPNSEEDNNDGQTPYNNATLDSELLTALTTNMLPVKVYVPTFKYTKYAEKILQDKTAEDKYNSQGHYNFEVENSEMNYNYQFNEENFPIQEFALYATIEKIERDSQGIIVGRTLIATTQNPITTRNGNIVLNAGASTNGFLNFTPTTQGQTSHYITQASEIIAAGEYIVSIIQGRYKSSFGENDFEKTSMFLFEILPAIPDFTVRGSTTLTPVSDGTIQTYYTNESDLKISWAASPNKYIVDIDIDSTIIRFGSKTLKASEIWGNENDPRYPKINNGEYIASLNLTEIGAYTHGQIIEITMYLKNSAASGTLPVTKRIEVDLSAPSDNVERLVDNSIPRNLISRDSLRTYLKANGIDTAANLRETSYNISSVKTDVLKYYSYTVEKNYIETLRAGKTRDVFEVYIRAFTDIDGTSSTKYNDNFPQSQETDPKSFLNSKDLFTEISSFEGFKADTYYEIVETDRANNLAIYTIYIVDKAKATTDNTSLISYSYRPTNADADETASYTASDYNAVVNHTGAIHNIYSLLGFKLKNINYFGDAWSFIELRTVDGSTRYLMKSPHIASNMLLEFGLNGIQSNPVSLESLIDGQTPSDLKNSLAVYDRLNQTNSIFYINVRTVPFNSELSLTPTSEYIRFNNAPTDAEINDTERAKVYVTSMRITVNNIELYNQTNKLGFASNWTSDANRNFIISRNANNLTFTLNPSLTFAINAKIEYNYTDNYGRSYKKIHLFRETGITQPITSENDLYAYTGDYGRLIYITQDGFQYHYNTAKHTVKAYNCIDGKQAGEVDPKIMSNVPSSDLAGVNTITFTHYAIGKPYNESYMLEVCDLTNGEVEEVVYFTLYNELPTANKYADSNAQGQFKIQDAHGTNVTEKIVDPNQSDSARYFSEVRVLFREYESASNLVRFPVRYSIRTDSTAWRQLTSGETIRAEGDVTEKFYLKIWYDETYISNEFGNTAYVFGRVPQSQIYEFNLSALTSTYWVERTDTGEILQPSGTDFIASNGRRYTTHYIVNISATDRDLIQVHVNEEQLLTVTWDDVNDVETADDPNIKSQLCTISNKEQVAGTNIPAFEITIAFSYVPTSSQIVKDFYTYNMNGSLDSTVNLMDSTTASFSLVVQDASTNDDFDHIEIQWTKYYGIQQNTINISIVKDGITLHPTIYTRKIRDGENYKEYNYTRLTYSGKYLIKFQDVAGNVQQFLRNSPSQTETFTLVFLKDVPFTVTYTDVETGTRKASLPIKQAVYNGTVTLNIDPVTRTEFYLQTGLPEITVYRNGVDISDEFERRSTSFAFTSTGYYEVEFSATSSEAGKGKIRSEKYQFMIINPNENKISYVYNKYSNYYVEKVVRKGVDITEQLVNSMDIEKVTINKKQYLTYLPLSYLDEKTGEGDYIITINSNNASIGNTSMPATFTFKVSINSGNAPIRISLAEGKNTTDPINISFNQTNVFAALGECQFQILSQTGNNTFRTLMTKQITAQTTTDYTVTIGDSYTGTFYIQFESPSGYLLFSYKVSRSAPLNAASIIAIVISAVVLVVAIILIIKLRKRISVK